MHNGRLAEIGQLRVEVDGTAVRRDHAGAGPAGARYLGHKPIVPNAATAPAEGLYFWGVRYPPAFALPVPPEDDPGADAAIRYHPPHQ